MQLHQAQSQYHPTLIWFDTFLARIHIAFLSTTAGALRRLSQEKVFYVRFEKFLIESFPRPGCAATHQHGHIIDSRSSKFATSEGKALLVKSSSTKMQLRPF